MTTTTAPCFFSQVKGDIVNGRVFVPQETQLLLATLALQADGKVCQPKAIGDQSYFNPDEYLSRQVRLSMAMNNSNN